MDVIKIPFVEKVGITQNSQGRLALPFDEANHNHLQTLHASAQFTLAETASGEILQQLFPDLAGKVIPVLRDSQIKFKKPATQAVYARPTVSDEDIEKFRSQFEKKGRASLSVKVDIHDGDETLTCTGSFNWFVQAIA